MEWVSEGAIWSDIRRVLTYMLCSIVNLYRDALQDALRDASDPLQVLTTFCYERNILCNLYMEFTLWYPVQEVLPNGRTSQCSNSEIEYAKKPNPWEVNKKKYVL